MYVCMYVCMYACGDVRLYAVCMSLTEISTFSKFANPKRSQRGTQRYLLPSLEFLSLSEISTFSKFANPKRSQRYITACITTINCLEQLAFTGASMDYGT